MHLIQLSMLPVADIVSDWLMTQFVEGIVNFFQGIIDTCCGMIPIIGGILGAIVFLYLRKRKRQS